MNETGLTLVARQKQFLSLLALDKYFSAFSPNFCLSLSRQKFQMILPFMLNVYCLGCSASITMKHPCIDQFTMKSLGGFLRRKLVLNSLVLHLLSCFTPSRLSAIFTM